MKKMKKLLALILAGLVILSVFAACAADDSGESDDEDDEEQTEKFDKYKKLSPEKVLEALEDAEEVELTIKQSSGELSMNYDIARDGDYLKMKRSYKNDSETEEETVYVDVDQGITYSESEDEGWTAQESEDREWEAFIEGMIDYYFGDETLGVFKSDDHYEKDGNRYTVTQETIDSKVEDARENDGLEGEWEITAYMERSSTVYTFYFEAKGDDGEFTLEIEIEFTDATVKLPSAVKDLIGESKTTDGSAETTDQTVITEQAPVTTTRPAQTQAATTATPPEDIPVVEPDDEIPEGMMLPAELISELKSARDAEISYLYIQADGRRERIEIVKDGDLVMVDETYEAYDYQTVWIYDLDEEMGYYWDNGQAYKKSTEDKGITWKYLVGNLEDMCAYTLDIVGSDIEYSDSQNGYVMTEDVLENYGITEWVFRYDLVNDAHSYRLIGPDGTESITLTVKLYHDSSVSIPENAIDADVQTGDEPEYSEYEGMAPSELYQAIESAEAMSISVTSDERHTVYTKDGDLLEVWIYEYESGNTAWRIIDMASGIGYQENGEGNWTTVELTETFTWEIFLTQAQLSADTYAFIDSNYSAFGEQDAELSIRSELLNGSNFSKITLGRNGAVYSLTETYTSGKSITTEFSFEDAIVVLPQV